MVFDRALEARTLFLVAAIGFGLGLTLTQLTTTASSLMSSPPSSLRQSATVAAPTSVPKLLKATTQLHNYESVYPVIPSDASLSSGRQWRYSWQVSVMCVLGAYGMVLASALRCFRLRAPAQRPLFAVQHGWSMGSISVNPELLKRFGLPVRPEDVHPGLAASILERRAPGGVPAKVDNNEVGYSKDALRAALAASYKPFDLDAPGMNVRSIDPPIFTLEGFLTDDECDALMQHSKPLLQPSTIGAGRLGYQGTELSERRTSTSVLLDESLLAARPSLGAPAVALQSRSLTLFPGATWNATGKLPAPDTVCFEALQVARYEAGQRFMEHEDGFPLMTAKRNQFQRLATVLVYLNDVAEGGQTRFPYLDLAITPKKGTALVFFPGFVDGRPDDRTLHEACPAVAEKWVAQQWVSVGVSPISATQPPPAPSATAEAPADTTDVETGKRRIQAKLDAMATHNEKAFNQYQQGKKQKTKQERKQDLDKKLGPKRGFGS